MIYPLKTVLFRRRNHLKTAMCMSTGLSFIFAIIITYKRVTFDMHRENKTDAQIDEPVNDIHQCSKPVRKHPDNPNVGSYWIIPDSPEEYTTHMKEICGEEDVENADQLDLCPCIPDNLETRSPVSHHSHPTWDMVNVSLGKDPLFTGGYWTPHLCHPRRKIAILIPFRDRDSHLMSFLAHNIKIWQKQQIEFRVFVAEQRQPIVFNKGALINAGYLELRKIYEFDCLLIHDVDMLIENEVNIIHCGQHVVHYGAFVNKFKYRLIYFSIFGGAVCLTPEIFERLNGYSNLFFGWGGEDDDFFERIKLTCSSWFRPPKTIARFHMIRHRRDKHNPRNKEAWNNVRRENKFTYINDGLNTIKYEVRRRELKPFYTWFLLDLIFPDN